MRKQIISASSLGEDPPRTVWLNLEELVDVEITSENPDYPIEAALLPRFEQGWRAAGPGTQTIRLVFKKPQQISRIGLHFREPSLRRTQEYVLGWSRDKNSPLREIIRQQWNFNPESAASETEEHAVNLPEVSVIELSITPDLSGGTALASLARLRVA